MTERAASRCEIAVDGVVDLLRALPESEPTGNPFAPEVDPLHARRVEFEERAVVELTDGRGLVRLGGHPLALELEVRFDPASGARALAVPLAAAVDGTAATTIDYWLAPLAAAPFVRLTEFELAPAWTFRCDIEEQVDLRFGSSPSGPLSRTASSEGTEFDANELDYAIAARVAEEHGVVEDEECSRVDLDVLRVKADPARQRLYEQLVLQFDRATAGEQRLEVRLIGGAPLREAAAMVPIAEADAALATARDDGSAGLLRLASSALQPGRDGRCTALELHESLFDFAVEIAHGAVIYDDQRSPTLRGLVAAFKPVKSAGGTRLDFAIRSQEVARPAPLLASPFPGKAIFRLEEHALRIDTQERFLFSAAGAVELPEGHALLLPCRVATRFGECAGTLDVRVVGPRGEPTAIAWTPSPGARLGAFDLPEVSADALWLELQPEEGGGPYWPSRVGRVGRGDGFDELLALVAAAGEREVAARHYQLDVRVRRGDATIAQLSTITLPDRATHLWAGGLGNYLRSWDIVTAGEAKIGDPELLPYLDGLFVAASITEQEGDRVALTLRGAVCHVEGAIESIETENPDAPLFERFAAERIVIDRVLDLELRDGIATAVLPGAPLAVEITVLRLAAK